MKEELQEKKTIKSDEVEVDSRNKEPEKPPEQRKQKRRTSEGGGGDEASIEVVRRPRGRPPGSKNKPKLPVVVTRETGDSGTVMRPHVLEISAGHDALDALSGFCRRRSLGLSVIAATGAVLNVVFRQSAISSLTATGEGGGTVTFHGRFEILSISGTLFPPLYTGSLSVTMAGPQGQVVGGMVVGPLVAAGTVTVIAAAFSNPRFCRLPEDDDVSVSVSVSVSGDGGRSEDMEEHQQQQQHGYHGHHGGGGGGGPVRLSETAIYSRHLPSDVIWARPSAGTTHRPPY